MRLGIFSPANIASSRFLPALDKFKNFEFAGIAVANKLERGEICDDERIKNSLFKAKNLVQKYGGKCYNSFNELLKDQNVDAIYVPLPPYLHYTWGKQVLLNNKHLLLEKPFTMNLNNTLELINVAKNNKLSIHENYMFVYHSQLNEIIGMLNNNVIGDIRLFKICFGFPLRTNPNDFRYIKKYGGGSIYDCAGYTLKLSSILMKNVNVVECSLFYDKRYDVDLYGSATIKGNCGNLAQLSFGMDCDYKCSLEVWGSKGTLSTNRIFTAPNNFKPKICLSFNGNDEIIELQPDDSFYNAIEYFYKQITENDIRQESYDDILKQAYLVEECKRIAVNGK